LAFGNEKNSLLTYRFGYVPTNTNLALKSKPMQGVVYKAKEIVQDRKIRHFQILAA